MEKLYPIIRRVRRPLIIQDDDAAPPAAPPQPVVEGEGKGTPQAEKERAKRATGEAKQ